MKTISILIFTVLLNACGSTKTTSNLNELENTASKMAQNDITIEYSAQSRGAFNKIILNNKTVSVQNKHNSEPLVTACTAEDWNALLEMVSNTNLKAITSLEAPSKAHQYDGAALANFSITKNGETYKAQTFDAGNPHKDIANLVNMITKIAAATKEKN